MTEPALGNYRWVAEQFKQGTAYERHRDRFSRRIVLSRENMSRKHIANRDELLAALEPLGFEAYSAEELSFGEQVALFEDAEVVIGFHGSGLTNMIFSEDTTYIEVFPADYYSTIFIQLARMLGLDYRCTFGTGETSEKGGGPHQDVTVDV